MIEFDPKTFTSVSTTKLPINGHYNEERVLLPTARGTDTVLSTLSIVQSATEGEGIWAPQPTFVVSAGPSRLLILAVVILFGLSFFMASLSKFDDLAFAADAIGYRVLVENLNAYPKVFATTLFMLASWIYLRKFPLK